MDEKILEFVDVLEKQIGVNDELIVELEERIKALKLENKRKQNKIKQFFKLMEE